MLQREPSDMFNGMQSYYPMQTQFGTIPYSSLIDLINDITLDLFQPKTSTFSTRALIWVHFKTVRYFSQSIFSSFSYLKDA